VLITTIVACFFQFFVVERSLEYKVVHTCVLHLSATMCLLNDSAMTASLLIQPAAHAQLCCHGCEFVLSLAWVFDYILPIIVAFDEIGARFGLITVPSPNQSPGCLVYCSPDTNVPM
jgi:hypothetical protein